MTEALVTPNVMTWARQRRGMEVADLASKLNVKPEAIDAWEAGEKRPTFRQAQRIAQALYVPFGFLYMSEPPIEELPLTDFRTTPGQSPRKPSPDLLDLLNDVMGKQQWFRDYRESEGAEALPFMGRFESTDQAEEVAGDIRTVIDVNSARSRAANWEGFMRELTRNAEGLGIMVMRSGVVGNNNHRPLNVEEFRGFSISDSFAPLIFINGRDFKGSQIFTFAHEMAHIWAGQGGLSNPDYGLRSGQDDGSLEQFCNRVAAETLVPGGDFRSRWGNGSSSLEAKIKSLTSHYKVSAMVVLRQAYDHDFLPVAAYRDIYGQLVEQASGIEPAGESGGNFHYTLMARNGASFTEAVILGAAGGTLLSSQAADLLGVKVKTLPAIARHLFGGPLNLD